MASLLREECGRLIITMRLKMVSSPSDSDICLYVIVRNLPASVFKHITGTKLAIPEISLNTHTHTHTHTNFLP
jgi:hypothetical protein